MGSCTASRQEEHLGSEQIAAPDGPDEPILADADDGILMNHGGDKDSDAEVHHGLEKEQNRGEDGLLLEHAELEMDGDNGELHDGGGEAKGPKQPEVLFENVPNHGKLSSCHVSDRAGQGGEDGA